MRSAGIGVSMQYTNLNQPQTIAAPSGVRPYTEFTAKVGPILQQIETRGSPAASCTARSPPPDRARSGSLRVRLEPCRATANASVAAGNDVAKMQHCASLLKNGG